MVRRITVGERRARLARRHRLLDETRAESAVEVAASVVGLHGTDPASVYLAAAARMRSASVDRIAAELYEERSLVRMLAMRRTMWVFPIELAAIAQAAATNAVAQNERRRLEKMLVDGEVAADAAAWLEVAERETVRALAARGEATGAELSADVPQLREQFRFGIGTKWEGVQTATTRLLLLLAAEGKMVRARPRGSWISSQYRWTPLESWLPGGFADWELEAAQAELVRRWLAAFGPATVEDVRWWTGWTLGATRHAVAAVGAAEVELDGAAGLVLPDRLVGRPHRRRLGPAARRRRRLPPARGRGSGGHGGDRRSRCAHHGVRGRDARYPALPDAAGAGAVRLVGPTLACPGAHHEREVRVVVFELARAKVLAD